MSILCPLVCDKSPDHRLDPSHLAVATLAGHLSRVGASCCSISDFNRIAFTSRDNMCDIIIDEEEMRGRMRVQTSSGQGRQEDGG